MKEKLYFQSYKKYFLSSYNKSHQLKSKLKYKPRKKNQRNNNPKHTLEIAVKKTLVKKTLKWKPTTAYASTRKRFYIFRALKYNWQHGIRPLSLYFLAFIATFCLLVFIIFHRQSSNTQSNTPSSLSSLSSFSHPDDGHSTLVAEASTNNEKEKETPHDKNNGKLEFTFIQDNKKILNYESTDEYISFDDIGDLINENEEEMDVRKWQSHRSSTSATPKNDKNIKSTSTTLSSKTKLFRKYIIKTGDSLWTIAKMHKVTIDTIISANNLSSKTIHTIIPGQRLRIPRYSGIYYQVKKGDSVVKLSKTYKISISKIKRYNDLNDYLVEGTALFLPGAKILGTQKKKLFGYIFTSPVAGTISSKYGMRVHPIKKVALFHTGVDIAQNENAPVRSAASGKVIFSGYEKTYGKMVVIKHNMGYSTVYAHLAKINVKKNQMVKKNAIIGRVGNTGLSTGPHLHFEIKQNNKFLNPLRFIKVRKNFIAHTRSSKDALHKASSTTAKIK